MALLSRFRDKESVVVEDLSVPEIGTRYMAEIFGHLELDGTTCLIGLGAKDVDETKSIYLSARNLPGVEVMPAAQLNAYAVLRPKKLVLTKAALEELTGNLKWDLSGPPSGGESEGTPGEEQ
jgi:large subunit ribosomal protein L4